MAESKPIQSNDLIQDNVFANTIDSAKKLEEALLNLITGFDMLIQKNADFLKVNRDPKTAKEIREVTNLLVNQEKIRQARIKTEQRLNQLQQAQDRALTTRIVENRKQAKIIEQEIKNNQKLNSEYAKAVKRLSEVKKAMKELTFVGKENTAEFKKLKDEYTDLNARIRKAEEGVGEFQRNVGNYKSGFDGLSFSIVQVGRELPALGYGFQTFIGAISNNLPMVFDEIKKTKDEIKAMTAAGKEVPTLSQRITAALFSWQTVMSVGLTVLIMFSKEIMNFAKNIFETGDAFKYSNKQMEKHTDLVNQIIKRYRKAKIEQQFYNDEIDEETRNKRLAQLEIADEVVSLDEDLAAKRKEIEANFGKEITYEKKKIATITLQNKETEMELLKTIDEEYYKSRIEQLEKIQIAASKGQGQMNEQIQQGIQNDINAAKKRLEEVRKTNAEIVKANEIYIDDYKLLIAAIESEESGRLRKRKEKEIAYNGKYVEEVEKLHDTVEKKTEDNAYKLLEIEVEQKRKGLEKIKEEDLKALKDSTLSQKEKAQERKRIEAAEFDARLALSKWYYDELNKLRKEDFDEAVKKLKEETRRNIDNRLEIMQLETNLIRNKRGWTYTERKKERKQAEVDKQKELEKLLRDYEDNLILEKEFKEKKKLINKKYSEYIKELERQEAIERTQTYIQLTQRALTFEQQILDREYNMQKAMLDRQLKLREESVDRQFELAKEGLDNTLAYEEQKRAKDEIKRRELEEKRARKTEQIQLAQAYLNAYNAELQQPGANPTSAAGRALADVLVAKGIGKVLAQFYEGTEDTGKVGQPLDNKGGRLAILHDNERVMTKKQNALVGDMKNDELAALAWKYQKGLMVDIPKERTFADSIVNDYQNRVMINYLKEIAEKPVQQIEIDKLGSFIETIYERGKKDVIIHKSKTRL